jgi:hypothetical protein
VRRARSKSEKSAARLQATRCERHSVETGVLEADVREQYLCFEEAHDEGLPRVIVKMR